MQICYEVSEVFIRQVERELQALNKSMHPITRKHAIQFIRYNIECGIQHSHLTNALKPIAHVFINESDQMQISKKDDNPPSTKQNT